MTKTKCEEGKDKNPVLKPEHKYICKKCGASSKKEEKLCKPQPIKK